MPASRSRNPLWVGIFLGLLFLHVISVSAASSPASPSPSAKSDLICHTDNPAECYPKIFSATDEFQVVHDDQDLPSGLHVRMDIWSGKKEAKLHTPGSDDPALEGLPVEQSVVVVDPEIAEDAPRIPQGAPAYEPVGVVKEPQVQNPDFTAALDFLKEHAENAPSDEKHPLDDALVDLEDISHDMYYGKKIVEDVDAVKSLFCLLTQRDPGQTLARDPADHRDFLASSILSSALQNNPPALQYLETYWDSLMSLQCASHAKPLGDIFFSSLEPSAQTNSDGASLEALWIRRALPVVGRLLKSDIIRPKFMEADGMRHFLQILLTKGDAWEAPRTRVSWIVSDTFLDTTVGAKTGLWPLKPASDPAICEKDHSMLEEGCWEYHLGQIIQETGGAEWAHELLTMLDTARVGTARVRDEL
ncbi:putative Nucleotide exchange factor SIL1 [Seiridium cardinale]|uniref:Nucleotide exchange factor SIL1 n=1 Tax=Seiridium cardinale TaxID=138064 RepID=A0ABR2XIK3_9PEZI